MSKFEKAFEAMKRLQRNYTAVRINNDMGPISKDAMKDLRDLVEELVVEAYGPLPSPFKPGVVCDGGMKPGEVYEFGTAGPVYAVEAGAIPPGFILVDEAGLRDQLLAPTFDDRTKQIVGLRIRELFKKPK